MVNIIFFFW